MNRLVVMIAVVRFTIYTLSVFECFAFNVFYPFEAVALLKTTLGYRFFNKRLCVYS